MKILITYEYFLPAYKAGGPVQSIKNTSFLLSAIQGVHTFILCSNKDLDGTISNVETGKWIDYSGNIKVYYNALHADKNAISAVISEVEPDLIFVNGLYSLPYTIYPLLYKGPARKILSVRGMLHPGALSQKSLKKKAFLTVFKMLGLHNRCAYHATTDEEVNYIKTHFGNDKKVWMVPNLPNALAYQQPCEKAKGELKLVSVALISPMKNFKLILLALNLCSSAITYHIYGPVKDIAYWNECKAIIAQLPDNIRIEYMGEVHPLLIDKTLQPYHYFILPSKSENFGHAIYEALSAGKPVITSHNTPWNGLEEVGAGYNVNPEDINTLSELLDKLSAVTGAEYVATTLKAREYITQQYDIDNIKQLYKKMFAV